MDELLTGVARQVEVVRAEGLSLVQLLERCGSTLPSSAQAPAKREHVLAAFERQELRVRRVLENVHGNICEFDNREVIAVSGGPRPDADGVHSAAAAAAGAARAMGKPTNLQPGTAEAPTMSGFYEDADASRTIAIKNVPRDLAHSLQSEMAWRKNTHANARKLNRYFLDKLALAFPTVDVQPRKKRNRARRAAAAAAAATAASASGPKPPALHQALRGLPQLKDFRLELHARTPQRLVCEWRNGLDTTIDFAPISSRPGGDRTGEEDVEPEEMEIANDQSGGGGEPELRRVRVAYVEVHPRARDDGPAPARAALATELGVAAQQQHFRFASQVGEEAALHRLLSWLDTEMAALKTAPLSSDFANALHLVPQARLL